MTKPPLLFLSPILPAFGGCGPSMRSAAILSTLAREYEVYLIVLDLWKKPAGGESVTELCTRSVVYPRSALANPESARISIECFSAIPFEVVYVFQLDMVPWSSCYIYPRDFQRPLCCLDLDDCTSKRERRFYELATRTGRTELAGQFGVSSAYIKQIEQFCIPTFDCVYVSNDADVVDLTDMSGWAHVHVLPNTIRLPENSHLRERPGEPFTFLFAGTMDYYPNEDGVCSFCSEILPIIREKAPRPFRVMIAGARPTAAVLELGNEEGVEVTGTVSDIANYYVQSDVAIVPLRVGGGTRLKILEACSHKRPVISTTVGAEGLAAPVLLADMPAEFAAACLTIMNDFRFARRLARTGFEWVRKTHTVEQLLRYPLPSRLPERAFTASRRPAPTG